MNTFYYKALNRDGQELSGEMESDSTTSVNKAIRKAGLFPTEILDAKAYRARTAPSTPSGPSLVTRVAAAAKTPIQVHVRGGRQTLGKSFVVLGLVIAGYFFFAYDTTVSTESQYIAGYGTVGGERVHNTGLMQNRLLGCIAGLVMTTIGVILIVSPQKPPT